ELVKADGIGAGLIFGPGDRWLGDDARDLAADRMRARMQREFRDSRADGEHANLRAALAEIGIPREGAGNHVEYEHRPEAMADKDDFVQRRLARTRQQRFSKKIDPCIDIRTAAVNVLVGANPIVQ